MLQILACLVGTGSPSAGKGEGQVSHVEVHGLCFPVLWCWASLSSLLFCFPQLENRKGNSWLKLLIGPQCLWSCFRRYMLSFIIIIINPTLSCLAKHLMKSLNSLKGPLIKSEMIKFPLGVTLQHLLFLQCSLCNCDVIPLGGQNGFWVSEGWQAWDEELPNISEQPVLAGTLSIATHSTVSGCANHSFLWSASEKPGLPSDAYQPQKQVRSSGLSQQVCSQEVSSSSPGTWLFSSFRVIV